MTISVKLIVAWDSSKKASEQHQRHLEVAKEVGIRQEKERVMEISTMYIGVLDNSKPQLSIMNVS